MKKQKEKIKEKGQVMLLTVLILSTLFLSATAIAGLLMVYQLSQVTKVVESTSAIFAADAGMERGLFKVYRCNGALQDPWSDPAGLAIICDGIGNVGNQSPVSPGCGAAPNCTPPFFKNDSNYKLTIISDIASGAHDPTATPATVQSIQATGRNGKSARAFKLRF